MTKKNLVNRRRNDAEKRRKVKQKMVKNAWKPWKLVAAVVFITAVAGFAEYFQFMAHPSNQPYLTMLVVFMACLANATAIWRYSKKQEKLGKQEKQRK